MLLETFVVLAALNGPPKMLGPEDYRCLNGVMYIQPGVKVPMGAPLYVTDWARRVVKYCGQTAHSVIGPDGQPIQ